MVSGVCLQKTDFNYVSESNDVISSEQQHKLDDPKDEVSMWCQLFSYKGSYLDFYTYYHLACVLAIFGITLYRHSLSKSSCIWQSFIPLTYRLNAWICYSSFISGCFIQLSFSSKFSFNYLLRENILSFLAMDQLAESFSLSWKKKITPYSHWLLHTSVKEISPIILIVTVIPICLITFSQHIFVF